MPSKKSIAIATLKQHLIELNLISNILEGNTWKASLKDTLTLYLGENSSLTNRLDNIFLTRTVDNHSRDYAYTEHVFEESKKENFKVLIQKTIGYVESNGVYQDPSRKNFLSNLTIIGLWSCLITIAGGLLTIGIFLGNLQKEREILESETQRRTSEQKHEASLKEQKELKTEIETLRKNQLTTIKK
ncbi:MAG: hypothetical protein WC623_15345 [Pedobacter sp.]|uniref:hypothetical protein n=1 Tax=Pedobacter sp. TaxID=1411316 RepID=UPI003569BA0A